MIFYKKCKSVSNQTVSFCIISITSCFETPNPNPYLLQMLQVTMDTPYSTPGTLLKFVLWSQRQESYNMKRETAEQTIRKTLVPGHVCANVASLSDPAQVIIDTSLATTFHSHFTSQFQRNSPFHSSIIKSCFF